MANSEHIKWLLEGVESWNERRQKVPGKGQVSLSQKDSLALGLYTGKRRWERRWGNALSRI